MTILAYTVFFISSKGSEVGGHALFPDMLLIVHWHIHQNKARPFPGAFRWNMWWWFMVVMAGWSKKFAGNPSYPWEWETTCNELFLKRAGWSGVIEVNTAAGPHPGTLEKNLEDEALILAAIAVTIIYGWQGIWSRQGRQVYLQELAERGLEFCVLWSPAFAEYCVAVVLTAT